MDYKQSLIATMAKVNEEKAKSEIELKRLEEEFANVKLNPYGITSIDFSKRQDISQDNLKMEGVLMGLQLALDSWEEAQLGVAAE